MAYKVVFLLSALTVAALALPAVPSGPGYGIPHPIPVDPPRYNFNYAVKDYNGNDFGHQESRDGYNTQGSYYALLPDTRLQKVDYYVNGDSGYIAQVSYEGEAQYPAYQPGPSYHDVPSYG